MRTIAHVYPTYAEAARVVSSLESAGIPHSDISIVSGDKNYSASNHGTMAGTTGTTGTNTGMTSGDPEQGAATGAGTGASLGTVLGGGAGLLAGIGALAIPGVGPVVAAGWLVATLTGAGIGAAGGGLVGSLTGAGVSKDEADVYAEGVKRGGSLVTVRADEAEASRIEAVLSKSGSAGWQQRRTSYGNDWSGFNPAAVGVGTGASAVPSAETPTALGIGSDPARRL